MAGANGAGKKFVMRDHVGFKVVAREEGVGTRWDYVIRFMEVSCGEFDEILIV